MTPDHDSAPHSAPRQVGYRRRQTHLRGARVALLAGAVAVTVAVAGASVLVPREKAQAVASVVPVASASLPTVTPAPTTTTTTATTPAPTPTASPSPAASSSAAAPLPKGSGSGRRVVFDESEQRVWLVESGGEVDRTYLVSGSRFDNLDPGTYRVQSKQRHATSYDYSGGMEYFIRFATGWRAPIGFHQIPVLNNGQPEQTVAELGTPLSAGCVRQAPADAKYLWNWAPVGTTVVVTA